MERESTGNQEERNRDKIAKKNVEKKSQREDGEEEIPSVLLAP